MALQEDRKRRRIAVIGAGTSGYLTVLYFCTKYPQYDIEWLYPEDNVTIGVGEGTVPEVTEFFQDLGISFKDIIETVGGSLKLGVKFENFAEEDFFHPFGKTDEDAAALEYIMKNDFIPDNIEDWNDISFHFNVGNLAPFLDKWFERFNNLTITRKTVKSVAEVDCDWFIDCTGFKRAFVNKYYQDNILSIDDSVPNNAAYVFRTDIPDNKRTTYTTCIGMDYGWIWNIPLKDQIGIGYVHDSKYDVKEDFIRYIRRTLNIEPDPKQIRKVNMVTGRNKHHYKSLGKKHLVSIGLSSSFIEPMEATGLYLTVFGIKQLDELMHGNITGDVYDNMINREFDTIVDFIVAHYKFSHHNNEYWNSYKNTHISLYKENNIFPRRSWNYILRKNKPLLSVEKMLKLRHGKPYKEWLNEKYT